VSAFSGICTYTLNNVPVGLSVSWSHSSLLTAVSSTNTTYTVKAIAPFVRGQGWVKATITTSGGETIEKQYDVWVGKPGTPIIDCAYSVIAKNSIFPIEASSNGASSYYWRISGAQVHSGQGESLIYAKTDGSCPNDFFLRVSSSNECGSSSTAYLTLPFDCSGGGMPLSLTMSPNPASETLNLNLTVDEADSNSSTAKMNSYNELPALYEVQIWSERKGLVKKQQLKGKKNQIDISSLQPGLYFVHIVYEDTVVKKQLIVE